MKTIKLGRLVLLVGGAIIGLSGLCAYGVAYFSELKYQAAYNDYRAGFHAEGEAAQGRTIDAFKLIYQNIRTISLLPSIKNTEKNGRQLSANDRETIVQIYENAYSNVQVSEIYVVPVTFDPAAIDPATGEPQAPIASFDSQITAGPDASPADAAGKPPEVEDEEYRLLTQQIAFLKETYPDSTKIDGLNVPLVSGHEVITCDNTEFDASHDDADRKGLVLSVPYYAEDGKLAGVIAAIVRTNVLRTFLPAADAALTSSSYGFTVFSKTPGQASESADSVKEGVPSAAIRTSEVFNIGTADPNARWTLWTGRPDAGFENVPAVVNIRHTERLGFVIVAALGALALFGFIYVIKRYLEPTQRLTHSMLAMASGNLSVDNPYSGRSDVIGQISRIVEAFGESQRVLKAVDATREKVIEELSRGLSRIQSGDLSYRIDDPFPAEMDGLRVAFNQAVERLQSVISTVKTGADVIRNGSEQISTASEALARRTETQAANIEETAAAVSEITSTLKETATGANQAKDAVAMARQDAVNCEDIVTNTITAMKGIDQSSREITQIIGLIDEIAFQTSLLALNAGVEAARAGEVGRGFAVVASEVRALAQRSASAAKQIKELIDTSRGHVELGVQLVGETGTSLVRIVSRVTEVDRVVSKIAVSVEQQATALQEINSAVNQMDQMTQQNAAMVEQSNTETRSLVQKSEDLNHMVGSFITGDEAQAA